MTAGAKAKKCPSPRASKVGKFCAVAGLKGAAFSVSSAVAGGTPRDVRGHFTAANRVLVELYDQSYTSASGATCAAE